jgi:hypothetical protein
LTLATFAPPGWPGQCVSAHPGMEWHAPPAGQPGPCSHLPDGPQQLQSFMALPHKNLASSLTFEKFWSYRL